jgi:hypothetical protein
VYFFFLATGQKRASKIIPLRTAAFVVARLPSWALQKKAALTGWFAAGRLRS